MPAHKKKAAPQPVSTPEEIELLERLERDLIKRAEEIYVKGGTADDIATQLKVPYSKALWLLKQLKETWSASIDRDYWRGRLLATYQAQMVELWGEWEKSKSRRTTIITNPDGSQTIKHEPADPRWQSGVLAVAKEISQLLGIRDGADAVQNVLIDNSIKQTLAPMSPDEYRKMLESGMSATSVPTLNGDVLSAL